MFISFQLVKEILLVLFLLFMLLYYHWMWFLLPVFNYVLLFTLWGLLLIQCLTDLGVVKMLQGASSSASLSLLWSLGKLFSLETFLFVGLFACYLIALSLEETVLLSQEGILRIGIIRLSLFGSWGRKIWDVLWTIKSIRLNIFPLSLSIHFKRFFILIWLTLVFKIMIINFIG